jgi:hypothetical protein
MLAALVEQRDVGAAGVLLGDRPFRLRVADEPDLFGGVGDRRNYAPVSGPNEMVGEGTGKRVWEFQGLIQRMCTS